MCFNMDSSRFVQTLFDIFLATVLFLVFCASLVQNQRSCIHFQLSNIWAGVMYCGDVFCKKRKQTAFRQSAQKKGKRMNKNKKSYQLSECFAFFRKKRPPFGGHYIVVFIKYIVTHTNPFMMGISMLTSNVRFDLQVCFHSVIDSMPAAIQHSNCSPDGDIIVGTPIIAGLMSLLIMFMISNARLIPINILMIVILFDLTIMLASFPV